MSLIYIASNELESLLFCLVARPFLPTPPPSSQKTENIQMGRPSLMMCGKKPVAPATWRLSGRGAVPESKKIYHLQNNLIPKFEGKNSAAPESKKYIIFKQPAPKFADENGAAIKSRPTQYSIVKEASKSFIVCSVSTQIKSIFRGLSEVPPGYAVGFQFI